jgi:hypothetical protein
MAAMRGAVRARNVRWTSTSPKGWHRAYEGEEQPSAKPKPCAGVRPALPIQPPFFSCVGLNDWIIIPGGCAPTATGGLDTDDTLQRFSTRLYGCTALHRSAYSHCAPRAGRRQRRRSSRRTGHAHAFSSPPALHWADGRPRAASGQARPASGTVSAHTPQRASRPSPGSLSQSHFCPSPCQTGRTSAPAAVDGDRRAGRPHHCEQARLWSSCAVREFASLPDRCGWCPTKRPPKHNRPRQPGVRW